MSPVLYFSWYFFRCYCCPGCKCLLFFISELSYLCHISLPLPALCEPLPVFKLYFSFVIFPPEGSPALCKPLPVSLFAAEHAIRWPENSTLSHNSAKYSRDKIRQKLTKKVVTISGNFAENLKCSRFLSTNLPTRFCSWPRSLWSLKWKCGNKYPHKSLFRRVVCVLMSDVSVGDFCKQKKIENF